jgi:hypothetical protein
MLPTHGQIMVVILLFLSIFMFSTDNKMEGMKQIEKNHYPSNRSPLATIR